MRYELITFGIANQLFGIDIMTIREIRAWSPVTRLPRVPDYVSGVVNLRGTVLPVIDLSVRLGWPATEATPRNPIVVVEVDGQSGQVLSTEKDDDTALNHAEALSLAKAIDVVTAVENGALIEAELEQERGELVWEIESLGPDNQENEYRVHAETGEILI